VLEETHGEVARRESHLADAREAEESAAARLARTRTALAALAPENLNADLERFARSIAAQEDLRRNAELRRATARVQLTLDGSSDPQADLEHARAKFETASELHATEARRAAAIALLHRLFTEAREAIDRNLSQPLADRINAYLQCLFGSSTTLTVRVSEGGIEGLELVRADDSAFGFATLSGGAREQVAAAVRLAMAEILAADHDGCLPVVFDDAFAFSDPQRIQALQRMLDYAARQGLQIILLTCTPGDYAGLGAAQIRLP
jgi:DNA repair exonuclease SbcCD ATPase subunit